MKIIIPFLLVAVLSGCVSAPLEQEVGWNTQDASPEELNIGDDSGSGTESGTAEMAGTGTGASSSSDREPEHGKPGGEQPLPPTEERPAEPQSPVPPGEKETQEPQEVDNLSSQDTAAQEESTSEESLSPPEEQEPQKEMPPPLSRHRLLAITASELDQQGLLPVRNAGELVSVFYDFNADGFDDLCVLTVDTPNPEDAEFAVLSDFSRLFSVPFVQSSFSLEFFFQESGGVAPVFSVPLGKRQVIEPLEIVQLSSKNMLPVAVSAGFQIIQGKQAEWVILSGSETYYRFTHLEAPGQKTLVRDIDEDGLLDIVLMEQNVEAGTGYETFLTWFRWDGSAFSEYRVTNLVRNLREYLSSLRESLISGRKEAFLSRLTLPDDRKERNFSPDSYPELLNGVFKAAFPSEAAESQSEEMNPFFEGRRIVDVVFPSILENPFTLKEEGGFEFSLPVRIAFEGQDQYYFRCVILLSRNPFTSPQFSLLVQ